MKKFKYSMESILRINIKLEDQARNNYSIARSRLTEEEEKLAMIKSRKIKYENDLRKERSAKLTLLKIRECEQAIETMEEKRQYQSNIVRNAKNRLEVAQIRLSKAVMERKTHEKLKEKAWDEYLIEYEAEQQKEVDELNSFKFSRPKLNQEDG